MLTSPICIDAPPGNAIRILAEGLSLPNSRLFYCTTSEDGQTSLELRVLRGTEACEDYVHDRKNHHDLLATVRVTGIPAAPRGVVHMEIGIYVAENENLTFTTREYPPGLPGESGTALPNRVQYEPGNEP